MKVSATFVFSGMPCYWQGEPGLDSTSKTVLFAPFDNETTLAQLLDSWVEDAMGQDRESFAEDASEEDIRDALVAMLSPEGRESLGSNEPCELAQNLPDTIGQDDESPVAIVVLEVAESVEAGS